MSVLVSAIIPVFNAEQFLREMLDSVIAQTYPAIEIIVVDDGSTDRSMEIAHSVLSNSGRDYLILRNTKKGPSSARNYGLANAKGAWVQFLDADDLLHPEKVARQVVALGEVDEVDAVYSSWAYLRNIDGHWAQEPIRCPEIESGRPIDLIGDANFAPFASQLIRRGKLLKVGGFDEAMWVIEDVDLLVRMAIDGCKFRKVDAGKPLFFYRLQPGSLSSSRLKEFIEGCLRCADAVKAYLDRDPAARHEDYCRLLPVYVQGVRYFAGADSGKFWAYIKKIRDISPSFVPPGSRLVRWGARLLGVGFAELFAFHARDIVARLTRAGGLRTAFDAKNSRDAGVAGLHTIF